MHELCIDEPTISGPIPYDEENLNTEKFNLNMHGINSTLLVQPANPSQLFGVEEYEEKEVNLSISMDEDELSCLNDNKMKNASKVAKKVHEEVKDVFKMPGLPVPIKKAVVPSAKFDIYEDKQMEEEADLSKSIYYEVSLMKVLYMCDISKKNALTHTKDLVLIHLTFFERTKFLFENR